MTPIAPPSPKSPLTEKLPFREMIALGLNDFAAVLYWTTFMKFLPIFYTDVFGLSAAVAGTFLLWSRLGDGISDVLIGIWADRTQSRWGKFRPFIIYGCIPFALSGVLAFTTPDFGPTGKLIWAIVTYNLLMILYTTTNIPAASLLGVMTADPVERTRLSSIKFVFAFSAGVVISVGLLPAVDFLGGDNPQFGWQLSFVFIGIATAILMMISGFGVTERIKPAIDDKSTLLKDFSYLLRNKPWLIVLGTTLTWILFVALRSSVSSHYFKYYIFDGSTEKVLQFLGMDFNFTGLASAFFGLGQAVSVVAALLIAGIAGKVPKKTLFSSLIILQILSTGAYYFLEPGQIGAIFLLEIIGSAAGAPTPVLLWALYAETADYGDWKFGRRTTALVFSASTMSQKFGWGIAAWIGLSILGWSGFVANEVPNEQVKDRLVELMSIVPCAFALIALVIFLFYPLTETKLRQIQSELAAKRT